MIHIDPEAAREIHIATRNTHPDGLIHPKRIMNVHVILYCLGGSMEIYEDGIPYTMTENDVLFLCAGIIHYGEKMCTPGTKLYALHLTTAENDSFTPDGIPGASGTVAIPPLVKCGSDPDIRSLFREILDTFWGISPVKDIKLSLLTSLMLTRLSECAGRGSPEDFAAKRCAAFLRSRTDTFFSPADLAARFSVPEKKLRSAFLSLYGCTPYSYQRDAKMTRAAELLVQRPEMPVSEIAFSLGYSDEFYFTKVFHSRYGTSPREFRKNQKL